jgi:hypothetical protein
LLNWLEVTSFSLPSIGTGQKLCSSASSDTMGNVANAYSNNKWTPATRETPLS